MESLFQITEILKNQQSLFEFVRFKLKISG